TRQHRLQSAVPLRDGGVYAHRRDERLELVRLERFLDELPRGEAKLLLPEHAARVDTGRFGHVAERPPDPVALHDAAELDCIWMLPELKSAVHLPDRGHFPPRS